MHHYIEDIELGIGDLIRTYFLPLSDSHIEDCRKFYKIVRVDNPYPVIELPDHLKHLGWNSRSWCVEGKKYWEIPVYEITELKSFQSSRMN